jgi:hypothetical protein
MTTWLDMRKTRAAAITALVLATLGALLWIRFSRGEREPVYQGKTLHYWLSAYWPGGADPTEQNRIAVRQIGTNAIPILLQWLSTKDGPVKKRMVTWISNHPWVPFRIESEVDRNFLAVSGFTILGKSQASSAVPALVEIVRTGGGTKTSGYNNVTFAMLVLADLDPEAATKAGIQFGTNRWSGTNVTALSWSAPPAATNK